MKKFILTILTLSLLIFLSYSFFYRVKIDSPAGTENKSVFFTVESGQNSEMIAKNLYDKGLINSKYFFVAYIKKTKLSASLKAGEYTLSPSLSIKAIADIIAKGETLEREREIKFIEGWKIDDMNDYLRKEAVIPGDDFKRLAAQKIKDTKLSLGSYTFLKDAPVTADLEGFLFPDTYRIFKNATTEDIVYKMLNNFDAKLTPQMRDDILNQGKSIFEIVTMASIIEKEVRSVADMKVVSGIFWNRIKGGQPLESCATLAYILGVNKKQYTLEDTRIDSPYNCYRNQGLPPGPISNPGLNAITAAIYPAKTNYLYFLTSSMDGKTIFSRTYDEHLRNKAKYLK
jgi:UPF0755 protein